MEFKLTVEQAGQILKRIDVPEIRKALIDELKEEEFKIRVELAKVTLMQDAIKRNDYSNLSEKTLHEMNVIVGRTLLIPESTQ